MCEGSFFWGGGLGSVVKGASYEGLEPNGGVVGTATFDEGPFLLDVNLPMSVDAVARVAIELENPVVEVDFGDGGGSCSLGRVGALEAADAEDVERLEAEVTLRRRNGNLRKGGLV